MEGKPKTHEEIVAETEKKIKDMEIESARLGEVIKDTKEYNDTHMNPNRGASHPEL